nr:MFS transporter [Spirochaetota bacterium]
MNRRMRTIGNTLRGLPRDFVLFIAAVSLFAFSQSVINTIFNNFLNESFLITDFQRGVLELPRELPGFLVVFFSALFFFLSARRLAALALVIAAAGSVLLGLFTPSYGVMLGWLFIFSTGQHLMLPLNQAIGMEFAHEGKTGRRLGQQAGAMNLAAIGGSFLVFLGFSYCGLGFTGSFVIAAFGFLAGAAVMFLMKPDAPLPANTKLILRREYGLFYWLNILFGTRKQIFLTFAPWVLVTVFNQKTEMVATLLTAGGIIGIAFNPLLGRAI